MKMTPTPFLLSCLAVLISAPSSGLVYTVGANATACDFTNLEAAIDAAASHVGPDEIHLGPGGSQQYAGLELLIDSSLVLVGGYPSCGAATPTGTTLLTGAFAESVVRVANQNVVELRNLILRSGGGLQGAGLEIYNLAEVTLDGVDVSANYSSGHGAGILASSGSSLTLRRSAVTDNVAGSSGGGIVCNNCSLRLLEDNVIVRNQAASAGGGIFLDGGSVLIHGANLIGGNTATRGGGIWAGSGELALTSVAGGLVEIVSNSASKPPVSGVREGGGIYLTGSGTSMIATDVRIEGNQVTGDSGYLNSCGGGIAVDGGSAALIQGRFLGATIDGNKARYGAAACVHNNSELTILQTSLRANGPWAATPDDIVGAYDGGRVVVEGAQVSDNTAFTLFRTWGTAEARLAHLTVAANAGPLFAVARVKEQAGAFATVELYSSIIWETAAVDVFRQDPGTTVIADCLSTIDADTIPTMAHGLVGQDPRFADFAARNFHLRHDSPLIDFCPPSVYSPVAGDLDGGVRGFDMVTIPNAPGATIDLGVDEYFSSQGEAIFFDGMETGDLSAWSQTAP